jgi:single-stranded DNA-binding protein
MLRFTATNAVISRGFDNKSAVKFSEDGSVVRFRIGERVYDKNAENNSRWVNINIKAFGNLAERVRKMQLKDGSCVNLTGRYDEDVWTDRETGEARSQPVVIADDIEFAGFKSKGSQKEDARSEPENDRGSTGSDKSSFKGYESFGGGSFFDEG